jgi:DNA-binding transcriptional LysR family regulator
MGIILMPPKAVEEDVAAGRLQRVLRDWKGVPLTAYAMTETRLLPAKTQRFIEFLRDRLATSTALPLGVP